MECVIAVVKNVLARKPSVPSASLDVKLDAVRNNFSLFVNLI
jgi:hypothetical protein